MQTPRQPVSLKEQIEQWRSYLRLRQASYAVDVAELENDLRKQIAGLVDAGLATDEAFLIAVKRMGSHDAFSREFARAHSNRLWTQLLLVPSDSGELRVAGQTDVIVAFCLAVAAAAAIKVPALFGLQLDEHKDEDVRFYVRNAGLLVLPLLTIYFAWKRRLETRTLRWLAVAFAAAGVFANVYPFAQASSTEVLMGLHLPIALWLVVGIAYAGGRWSQVDGRMDFIRFSGELFIYYVLIALGGGVLTAFMAMIFKAIGINVGPFIGAWLLPCGAAGAVLVASWLVEAKQSVLENMAPMLTRLFTPMFAVMLIMFLGTLLWTGRGIDVTREVLIAFDLLLVVVIGLLLYSASARGPQSPPNTFAVVQVVLVLSALLADAVALWAIAARITEFGFTPNRVAALGENVILLINLAWSAVLYVRVLRGRASFNSLEKWQTDYLPVYGAWAALVVILFPPLFRYI
ncbi:MAG: hypothetical protein ACM3NO_07525 [Deltaproteobacteria bacterium]